MINQTPQSTIPTPADYDAAYCVSLRGQLGLSPLAYREDCSDRYRACKRACSLQTHVREYPLGCPELERDFGRG